ncbi:unnamed protein product [Boreogadus saida]
MAAGLPQTLFQGPLIDREESSRGWMVRGGGNDNFSVRYFVRAESHTGLSTERAERVSLPPRITAPA